MIFPCRAGMCSGAYTGTVKPGSWYPVCMANSIWWLSTMTAILRSLAYGNAFTLSDQNHLQVLIPPLFGNGHLVLSETTIFHYKQTSFITVLVSFTLRWNDPKLKIWWPINNPILSRVTNRPRFYLDLTWLFRSEPGFIAGATGRRAPISCRVSWTRIRQLMFRASMHTRREPCFKDSRIEYVRGDLRSAEDCRRLVKGCDGVIMAAAMTGGPALWPRSRGVRSTIMWR